METDASILEKLRALPLDKQREVIRYIEALHRDFEDSDRPRAIVHGLWKHLAAPLSDAEVRSLRDEMWGRFPREISE